MVWQDLECRKTGKNVTPVHVIGFADTGEIKGMNGIFLATMLPINLSKSGLHRKRLIDYVPKFKLNDGSGIARDKPVILVILDSPRNTGVDCIP